MAMNIKYKLIILLTILFGVFSSPTFATEIAYINGGYVFENITAWKKFQADIKQHSNKVKDVVIKQESEIEKIWGEINKLRDEKANINKIANLEKKFKQKSQKLQTYVQIQKTKMDKLYIGQQNFVKEKIMEIVSDFAKEKKLDLVLNISKKSLNSNLVYGKDNLDITTQVLKIANKNITNIKVDLNYKEGM